MVRIVKHCQKSMGIGPVPGQRIVSLTIHTLPAPPPYPIALGIIYTSNPFYNSLQFPLYLPFLSLYIIHLSKVIPKSYITYPLPTALRFVIMPGMGKWRRASDYIDKVANSDENDLSEIPWRGEVMERMLEGDVDGMKEAASPSLQYNIIKLAHEGESEQLRLQALQFALGQAGHGVVQKVDKRVSYESLPTDQLVAMLRSKLGKLAELVPGFTTDRLLEEVTAQEEDDAEAITVEATDAD